MEFIKQIVLLLFLMYASIFVWVRLIMPQDHSSSNVLASEKGMIPYTNGVSQEYINMDKCIAPVNY